MKLSREQANMLNRQNMVAKLMEKTKSEQVNLFAFFALEVSARGQRRLHQIAERFVATYVAKPNAVRLWSR